ncbi:MAG: hypothetical protein ACI4VQ_06775 [Clostridia bacterium]
MYTNLNAEQSVQFGELVMKYQSALHDAQMKDPTHFVRRGYWIIPKEFFDVWKQMEPDVRKAFCEWEESYVASLNFCRRTSPDIHGLALMPANSGSSIICDIDIADGGTIKSLFVEHKWHDLK